MDSQTSSDAGPSAAPLRPTHTPEEIEAILATGRDKIASPYTIRRSEQSAARHWDVFYSKNQDRFFKDRHWTNREFEALKGISGSGNDDSAETKPPRAADPEGEDQEAESQILITGSLQEQDNPVLLEVGCGVGNMVWPLLSAIPNLLVHCCDFSPRAVEIVKKHPLAQSEGAEERVHPFVFDITQSDPPLSSWILPHTFGRPTIISLIFVLSAIPPQHHLPVLQSLFSLLAPGGSLIFRDYGRGDLAQLRFHSKVAWAEPSLLSSKYDYYKRGDGTMTFFFSPEYLEDLAKELTQVEESEVKMITRVGVNRKKGVELRRNFVQAYWKKK